MSWRDGDPAIGPERGRGAGPAAGAGRFAAAVVPALPARWRQAAARFCRSKFLVSPAFDLVFFILSPLLALGLGLALSHSPLNRGEVYNGANWVDIFLSVFVMAHLFITVFRTHCDVKIFRLYPARFTVVPLLLLVVMGASNWALVIGLVLATFWDVYHSCMQTFGLGRLYDKAAGNAGHVGRRLDILLNLLLYAGPIAAGATLMNHVNDFSEFEKVGAFFFTEIPAYVQFNAGILSWLVIATGIPFLLYYVYAYARLARQGYKVSYQKVALLVSTGLCSIYAWGFNPFGMAFFIMNFFHAWQYFAIVWWSEKKTIVRVFGLQRRARALAWAMVIFLSVALAYGLVAGLYDGDNDWFISAFLVVSLTHFWFDGFIWSAQRNQI